MKLNHLITVAAAMALTSGAAYAQTQSATQPVDPPTPPAATEPMTPPPADAATTTTDVTTSAATGVTTATSATSYATGASVTTSMVTNGPVPDTAENRAKYGSPMSNAGKRTKPVGN